MAKEITIEIDDGAIPDGWEPERFGIPKAKEVVVGYDSTGETIAYVMREDGTIPAMIIRKKYDPGITCIPKGWWVWFFDTCWVASTSVGICDEAVRGLEFLAGFIPPEDGKPRQIKLKGRHGSRQNPHHDNSTRFGTSFNQPKKTAG